MLGAFSPSEVGHINEFCARTQAERPRDWRIRMDDSGANTNPDLFFSQPWLDHEELDPYALGGPDFAVVERCMGGAENVCTYEFNFRESPGGFGRTRMNFHQ